MADEFPNLGVNEPEQKPGIGQRIMNWIKDNHEKQPSVMAQLEAVVRESMKDVRQTMNEVFFGHGEHSPEAGTPMNPTQQQVTQEQGNFHGYSAMMEEAMQQSQYLPRSQDKGISH